ncbi:MAG: PxKF domain-containing protein, partial [Motilibacteraceae bacterium]
IDDVTGALDAGAAFRERVRTSGFTPDERRTLLNRGASAADITALENDWVADGQVRTMTKDQVLGMFDDVLAANAGMRQALADSAAGWDDVVSSLEQRVDEVHPEADAGGPYTAPHGEVTLDATGSHPSPAAALIRSYAWDLDGDGQFDDATGARPAVHVDTSRTVAVQVTDDNGRQATDFAQVTVTGGDRAPVVSSASPDSPVTITTGSTVPLQVSASDPDGDLISYAWSVDGDPVEGSASSLTYAPSEDAVGEHVVAVSVTAGTRTTTHQWSVSVLAPDADEDGWTATPDCDDTRADVHPGAYERLGNDRDDDCDPASPDGPTGGITGSVSAWGSAIGVGLPPRANQSLPYATPVQVGSLGSTVRQVESSDTTGLAVLADGTVRSWGMNWSGRLGDGTSTDRWTPVSVLNVGGEAGSQLNGVASVSADADAVLALRSNGSVVSWGDNGNRQLGDGSTVASRPVPVPVLTDQQQPLTGVVQVELGENSAYAVMADGTVRTWGVDRCDGGTDSTKAVRRNLATTNARFGTGVVQIASGDGGGALVRKADGSVWSCAGYDTTLGRPHTIYDVNDLRRVTGLGSGVVDVTMGSSAAAALTEDGSLWMWGKNLNHSLDVAGVATGNLQETPVKVTLPPGAPVLDVESDYSDTFFAVRADGSVLAWGSDTYGSSGTGQTGYVKGFAVLDLGGARGIAVANSVWNGIALTRPADDADLEVPAQYVTASVADTEVTEGTRGSATLTLSQPAPFDLTVTYTVGDGSAQTAPVAQGATSAELPVLVADNAFDEPDRELPLQVLGISHSVRVAGGAAVVTVHDDDAAPVVSVGDVQVAEGNTSLTDVSVPVTLSAASGQDVQVAWSTQDGTATAPSDYAGAHGVAIIPAGQTSATVHLSVVGDSAVEPDEQLTVQLADPVNATVGTGSGTVTVADDEPLGVDVSDVTVTEGDSGTAPATFTVSAPAIPVGETLTVPWSVVGGTAEVGSDVQAAHGEVTLTSDAPSTEVSVQVVGDTVAEQPTDEVFRLLLGRDLVTSARRPVIPGDGGGVGTITDDDVAVSVDAGPDLDGVEGSAVAVHGTASAPATWTVDDPRCSIADPAALDTTVTCVDDLVATLTLTADDGTDPAVSDTASVTVRNAAPSLRITGPADGATVDVGQPVTLSTEVSDPGADAVTCSVDWGDGTTSTGCAPSHTYAAAGDRTVTVTADDGDGGTGTASIRLTVAPPRTDWPFDGFFQPVDNLPTVNVVKAGSAVPLTFSLHGFRGTDIFAAGYPASASHACGSTTQGDPLEETVTPGASELSYDAGTDRYQYVWKTAKSWSGQCRTLTVKLADGSVHTAEFRLR